MKQTIVKLILSALCVSFIVLLLTYGWGDLNNAQKTTAIVGMVICPPFFLISTWTSSYCKQGQQ